MVQGENVLSWKFWQSSLSKLCRQGSDSVRRSSYGDIGLARQDWLGVHSLRSLKSFIKATDPENLGWVMIESLLNSWPLTDWADARVSV